MAPRTKPTETDESAAEEPEADKAEVRSVVLELLGELGLVGSSDASEESTDEPATTETPGKRESLRDTEDRFERIVTHALDKLAGSSSKDEKAAERETAATEQAPGKTPWLRRAIGLAE